MKTSRFTDSQIMAIFKQAEAGMPAPELCREHGISIASLNKMYAKVQLQADILKEVLQKK